MPQDGEVRRRLRKHGSDERQQHKLEGQRSAQMANGSMPVSGAHHDRVDDIEDEVPMERKSKWLFKMSRSKGNSPPQLHPKDPRTSSDGRGRTRPLDLKIINELFVWAEHARQSADDRTIIDEVSTLFFLTDQHIKNYYDSAHRPLSEDARDTLESLDFPHLPVPVVDLFKEAQFPDSIIKHCLVYVMTRTISSDDSLPYPSLLPLEFTLLLRTLRNSKAEPRKIPRMDQALSSYRMSCLYLWPNIQEDQIWITLRDEVIQGLVSKLTRAFAPWEKPGRSGSRRSENLGGLLVQASNLGILLFSQPSVFEFNWKLPMEAQRASEIPTAPRLLKVFDEKAQKLDPAQLMLILEVEFAGVEINYEEPRGVEGFEENVKQLPNDSQDTHSEPPASQPLEPIISGEHKPQNNLAPKKQGGAVPNRKLVANPGAQGHDIISNLPRSVSKKQ